MPLGKSIACKAGHLVPDFRDEGFRVALFSTIGNELVLYFLEFLPRTKLTTHAPAEYIGLTKVQTGKMVGHFDHIFLVDHHPVGVRHNLQHHGMSLFLGSALIAMAQNIFPHHTAFGHTGTDDRTGGHQTQIVVNLKFFEQHAHGGRFHIKTAHTLCGLDQVVDDGVFFKSFDVMDVDIAIFFGLVVGNDFQCLFDFAQTTLPQNIKLVKANIFGNDHVVLCGREAFWR